MIRADRVHPGKLLNYHYEGFEKIEEAFNVMNKKPRDLIKPIVYVNWDKKPNELNCLFNPCLLIGRGFVFVLAAT